jgi:5'-nucleotidase
MTRGLRWGRLVGLMAAALVLALSAIWASQAASKPAPSDRISNLQILGVNDFHGNLEPPSKVGNRTVGGAAYLDAYLEQAEAENPDRTITVHAGDMVGGSPLISSYFHDEPTIYATNLMQFDIGTLGNHEFDEGGEEMLRLINGGHREDGFQFKDGADGQPVDTSDPDFPGADFPYVAANTLYKDTGETVLTPYKVLQRDGINVGFIGVTTLETPSIVTPDAVAPFHYTDISDTVNRYARQLQDQGVKTIVVLAHAGGNQTSAAEARGEIIDETAQMSKFVDVVVAGHSHTRLNLRVNNKLVVEAFSFGTAFDKINLQVDRRTKDVVGSSADIVTTFDDAIQPNPQTAALVAEYRDRIAPIANRVVGTAAEDVTRATTPAGESALGDLIADGQRGYANAQMAFMNPGGIRADIQAGEVTYGELFSVQPFDNQVVRMELTGDQILRLLEQQFQIDQNGNPRTRILQVSGLKFSYNSQNPAGQRITSVTLPDGTPIDRNATYTVAANSFLATGGDGFTVFKEGQNPETIGGDLDALENHIDGLDQPFEAPDPVAEPRITREG